MIEKNFEQELKELINRHSIENESDTPDYILARYILNCLYSYSCAVRTRDQFFGFEPWKRIHKNLEEDGDAQ